MGSRGMAMLAAVAVLAAAAATQAGARPFGVTPSQLTIQANIQNGVTTVRGTEGEPRSPAFNGRVLSSKARCKRNRTVLLFGGTDGRIPFRAAARRAPEGFVLMNAVKSKRGGGWAVWNPNFPSTFSGEVVARVTRKRVFRARCGQARSEVIQVFADK